MSGDVQAGQQVGHTRYGVGEVLLTTGDTAVVRFESGIAEVLLRELNVQRDFYESLERGVLDDPEQLTLRLQAELIRHLNDSWGVFSRSRIALLPHQLWVCRQVLQTWPPRWLIADDVGLGKTVEAGLILWPLLSSRQVTRLLVIAPASLTTQWQARMKQMFDIRLTIYDPSQDRPASEGSGYWDIHSQVIASLHTLRADRGGRRQRLLEAEPWDLVIVDEAHHLSAYEGASKSLGYGLLHDLEQAGRIEGLLLFSATPHRGHDYGFLALLQLLRPDLFSVNEPLNLQLGGLRETVIRNNKQTVTNLKGERLFQPPIVSSEEYTYSAEEAAFYEEMSVFIASGQAYADSLNNVRDRQAVGLVLTALQKLASSSVAAVTQALRRRQEKVKGRIQDLEAALEEYREAAQEGSDDAAVMEEVIGTLGLPLMHNEHQRIAELLQRSEQIAAETKIETILEAIETRYTGRSVLLFTEYKTTQSLLLTRLAQRYGPEQVTFINGDGRVLIDGRWVDLTREQAAGAFNEGKVRFMVSTEAAGEGIDLQRSCHTLIHVDLPWNPMRLHQRVGRINRYGQTERVEVLSLRNPGTVESRIWELLNQKLQSITRAFTEVMDDPEDLTALVLGMAPTGSFERLFAEGADVERSDMRAWFEEQTATLGGHGVVKAVEALIGYSARFDFEEVSPLIPRVDLPDLLPFMRRILDYNKHVHKENEAGLSFKTPEPWLKELGVRRNYSGLRFSRQGEGDIGGVGHRAVDNALAQAREFQGHVTALPGLEVPLYIYRVSERVTGQPGHRVTLVGCQATSDSSTPQWLRDWEVLQLLNALPKRLGSGGDFPLSQQHAAQAQMYQRLLQDALPSLGLQYLVPQVEPFALLLNEP